MDIFLSNECIGAHQMEMEKIKTTVWFFWKKYFSFQHFHLDWVPRVCAANWNMFPFDGISFFISYTSIKF